jgi:hypothetical protein
MGMSPKGSCETPVRERSRNPSRESWESPPLKGGEDVNKAFQGKGHEISLAVWILAGIFVLRFIMMALKFGG